MRTRSTKHRRRKRCQARASNPGNRRKHKGNSSFDEDKRPFTDHRVLSVIEDLVTCTCRHEMWKKLSEIHVQKKCVKQAGLTTEFHEYTMSPGDTVAQHVAKLENMANQLKDIGEAVSDIMIMAKIISTYIAIEIQRLCFGVGQRASKHAATVQQEPSRRTELLETTVLFLRKCSAIR